MLAGREVLKTLDKYLAASASFAMETTLSSRKHSSLIAQARSAGFSSHLIFVGLDNPERCISRIRERIAQGGHAVPEPDIRRRYARSLANCEPAIRLVDLAYLYDNSGDAHRLVLIAKDGKIVWQTDAPPPWFLTAGLL
jgi:predicted ABC-type ATPase